MKVIIGYDLGDRFVEELRDEFADVEFTIAITPADQAREAADAEVIFGSLQRDGFLAAKELKWYSYIGIGFDSDLKRVPELADSDVTMTISRGAHVPAMADHAFAMILAFAHRLRDALEDQSNHDFNTQRYHRSIVELPGMTLGIVAFGDIGREVAKRASGFDMEVYAVDLVPVPPPSGVREVWGLDRLDKLLRISDWLVVTAPATSSTLGMIGREQLAKIKKGAHIVVVSRGGIVDEAALAEALQSGRVGGAAARARGRGRHG